MEVQVDFYIALLKMMHRIGQTRAFRQAQQSGSAPSPCPSEILPAGTRISARCATQGTGAETIGIAIFYNTFAGVPA